MHIRKNPDTTCETTNRIGDQSIPHRGSATQKESTVVTEQLDFQSLALLHDYVLWKLCENDGVYYCSVRNVEYDARGILSDGSLWSRCLPSRKESKLAMLAAIRDAHEEQQCREQQLQDGNTTTKRDDNFHRTMSRSASKRPHA